MNWRQISALLLLLTAAGCAQPTPALSALTLIPPIATRGVTPSPEAGPTALPAPSPAPTDTPAPTPSVGHFILARPVPAEANPFPDKGYPYGSTAEGTREPHHGVEFINPLGTPVLAAAEGTVLFAGNDAEQALYSPWKHFYGNLVVLEHHLNGETCYTLYAHLSEIVVQNGESVQRGARIGSIGMTGAAIGPHLHFEVRCGGWAYTDTRNPVLWLEPADPARRGALSGRIQRADGTPVHTHFTVQYLREGVLIHQYNLETYAPEQYPVPTDAENFALGDLPSGTYRIAVVAAGQVFERFVTVTEDAVAEVTITFP